MKSYAGSIISPALQISVLAAIFLAGVGCTENRQTPMRVGVSVWPGYEPLFLAREKGYFSEDDVKLLEYTSITGESRAFLNGALDAAAVTLDTAIKLHASGVRFKVVLVLDVSNGGDILLAQPGIQTLQELKGKRVGVETTAIGDYMITRALGQAGMQLTDIKVVPLEVAEHERAFDERRVEAVVTYDPVRAKLLSKGAIRLFDSSMIPGEIVDVLVVRDSYLETGEEQLLTLIRGWFRAVQTVQERGDDSIHFMAEREKVSDKEFLDLLQGVRLMGAEDNRGQLTGASPSLAEAGQRLVTRMRENTLIDSDIAIRDLLDDRYLLRAAQ